MLLIPTGFYQSSGIIPSDLAGLEVWLDPSDAAYYTLLSGNYLSLNNKAGAHTLVSSNILKQPLQQTKANGLTYMNFDEVANQCMYSTTPFDFSSTDKLTMFWAGQRHQNGNALFFELTPNQNAYVDGFIFNVNSSSQFAPSCKGNVGYYNPHITSGETSPLNTDESYSICMDKGAVVEVFNAYKNGEFKTLINGTTQNNTNNFGNQLGYIGCRGNGTTVDLDGDYYELLIYNRVLSDSEIIAVHKYLNKKWDLY
jgi:hypothetical protein